HEPLISFTALRGIRPWLASHDSLKGPLPGNLPNQFYHWAVGGGPFFTYFAAQSDNASNQVARLADWAVDDFGQRLLTNGGIGKMDRSTNGAFWSGAPYLTPRLLPASLPEGDFIQLNLFAVPPSQHPLPEELLFSLRARTNILYYDWETTGQH